MSLYTVREMFYTKILHQMLKRQNVMAQCIKMTELSDNYVQTTL